jgi:hypothetical protein
MQVRVGSSHGLCKGLAELLWALRVVFVLTLQVRSLSKFWAMSRMLSTSIMLAASERVCMAKSSSLRGGQTA